MHLPNGHRAGARWITKSILPSCLLLIWCLSSACDHAPRQRYLKSVPRSERKGLAILNFSNTSPARLSAEFEPWEYGIPAMLMTDLESIGLFNIVSRERLKDILAEQKLQASGLVDSDTAVKLGRLMAAHFILTGSFNSMDGRLRIEANVFSVQSGVQLGAAAVSGKTDMFFELEKQLVLKISNYLKAMLNEDERIEIAQNVETRSYKASLANYAGESALLEARDLTGSGESGEAEFALQRAKDSFKKALKYDPGYQRAKNNLRQLLMGMPLTL